MVRSSQKGYLTGELQMHQLRIWFSTVQCALIAGGAATEQDFTVSANGFIWISALDGLIPETHSLIPKTHGLIPKHTV